MPAAPRTERSTVRRQPKRAAYDWDTIASVIDQALICHVAFERDGQPFVIPTLHARIGQEVVLHGARGSRLVAHIAEGRPVCLAFTLIDGLVLARSAFHHSINYRSAVAFGTGRLVECDAERLASLEAIVEHINPGRWAEVRRPDAQELAATSVVAVRIDDASAKVRTGPPIDAEEDYALSVWAGVLPLETHALAPVPDPRLAAGLAVSPSVTARRTKRRR